MLTNSVTNGIVDSRLDAGIEVVPEVMQYVTDGNGQIKVDAKAGVDNLKSKNLESSKLPQGIDFAHNIARGILSPLFVDIQYDIIKSILNGQIKVDGNAYVDKAVTRLNENLVNDGLDSIEVPEFGINFEHNVAFGFLIPGTVNVKGCTITGLANCYRIDDSFTKINKLSGPMVSVRARIGIRTASVKYSGKVSLFLLGPQIKIMGTLTNISMETDLAVEKSLAVTVNKFGVSSAGDLTFEFENLEKFDYLIEEISVELKTNIMKTILDFLKKSVRERLEIIVKELPLRI